MKKSYKMSEILEQLHRLFELPITEPICIDRLSILQYSQFECSYLLMLHYKDVYCVVVITLRYGWTNYDIHYALNLDDASERYFKLGSDLFVQYGKLDPAFFGSRHD